MVIETVFDTGLVSFNTLKIFCNFIVLEIKYNLSNNFFYDMIPGHEYIMILYS